MKRRMSGTVPFVQTSVRILGENQIDVFEALCHLAHRQPYQLAADIVLEYIRAHRHDAGVAELLEAMREQRRQDDQVVARRSGLKLLRGTG